MLSAQRRPVQMTSEKTTLQREKFLAIIKQAEEEAKQERLAGLPLGEWWQEFKEGVIRPIFENAVLALQTAGYTTASQLDKNGTGILLQAGNPSLHLEFYLEGLQIRTLSTASSVKAALWDDRKYCTEESVTELVNKFLAHVA